MMKFKSDPAKIATIAVPVISVTLYAWGYTLNLYSELELGVPKEFTATFSIQETLFTGGLTALLFFFPIIVILSAIWAFVDRVFNPRWLAKVAAFKDRPMWLRVMALLLLFFASLLAEMPIAHLLKKKPSLQSVSLLELSRQDGGYQMPPKLFYLTRRDNFLLFIDSDEIGAGKVYVIREDEIKKMVLDPRKPR
jgi:hypothetical protein